jgi:hypothetical protein
MSTIGQFATYVYMKSWFLHRYRYTLGKISAKQSYQRQLWTLVGLTLDKRIPQCCGLIASKDRRIYYRRFFELTPGDFEGVYRILQDYPTMCEYEDTTHESCQAYEQEWNICVTQLNVAIAERRTRRATYKNLLQYLRLGYCRKDPFWYILQRFYSRAFNVW